MAFHPEKIYGQEARVLLIAFVEGLKKGYGDARD